MVAVTRASRFLSPPDIIVELPPPRPHVRSAEGHIAVSFLFQCSLERQRHGKEAFSNVSSHVSVLNKYCKCINNYLNKSQEMMSTSSKSQPGRDVKDEHGDDRTMKAASPSCVGRHTDA